MVNRVEEGRLEEGREYPCGVVVVEAAEAVEEAEAVHRHTLVVVEEELGEALQAVWAEVGLVEEISPRLHHRLIERLPLPAVAVARRHLPPRIATEVRCLIYPLPVVIHVFLICGVKLTVLAVVAVNPLIL